MLTFSVLIGFGDYFDIDGQQPQQINKGWVWANVKWKQIIPKARDLKERWLDKYGRKSDSIILKTFINIYTYFTVIPFRLRLLRDRPSLEMKFKFEIICWNVQRCTSTKENELIFLRKSGIFVERISVCNAMENWRSMANTVCDAPIPLTS